MIPFSDINLQHEEIKKELKQAINRVIKRGDFILGEDVRLFENEFARFCKVKYAVGVSSGTAALFLALKSLGIKEGDEVIVPDFTYIATALAVSYTGAKPLFVDINEHTYNIDSNKIRGAITRNTRAIIPVHLYGQPADMGAIMGIARDYNLRVVEDAAQAHGARIKMQGGDWKRCGEIGDIGCFSFYPSKNMGALGDAGMVVTDNEGYYKKLLMLRDYGRISKYEHAMVGYNSRLDTIQAAVLRLKLKKIDKWNFMRQEAARFYDRGLSDTPGVVSPHISQGLNHIYHVYAIRIKKREEFLRKCKENGISVIVHYPIPLHLQKAYAGLGYKAGDFPVAEAVAKEIVSLPIYPHIKKSQIKRVVSLIKEHIKT